MKGVIITEFLELVEEKYDLQTVNEMLEKAGYDIGFSAVATYDSKIIHELSQVLGELKNIDRQMLLEIYGEFMFRKFKLGHTEFFDRAPDLYSFLDSIETYIHQEVLKLYPNAELPRFESIYQEDGTYSLIYYSSRKMYSFAKGLINGSIKYYDPTKKMQVNMLQNDGSEVEFILF